MSPIDYALMVPVFVVLIYIIFWGQACALLVSKRMLASNAGRTRTSFKAVREQGKKYIGPLFLTELLRGIITILCMLLLIVPGVIYSVRTMFYDIMMIERGKIAYARDALAPSTHLVRGHTWDILWRVVIISLCVFLPLGLISAVLSGTLTAIDERLITLAILLADFIESFGTVFFIVCIVALYKDLKHAQ